jgi:hypothetical protein
VKKFSIVIKDPVSEANAFPKFIRMVGPIFNVNLVRGTDGELKDTSVVEFKSPIARDAENDKIKMEFDIKLGHTFIKANQNSDDSFTIKVDRSLITEMESKTYRV